MNHCMPSFDEISAGWREYPEQTDKVIPICSRNKGITKIMYGK